MPEPVARVPSVFERPDVRRAEVAGVGGICTARANSEEADPVMFGFPIPITVGGYWFGGEFPPVAAAKHPRAICHNKMFNASSLEEDPILPIAHAVRQALGLRWIPAPELPESAERSHPQQTGRFLEFFNRRNK